MAEKKIGAKTFRFALVIGVDLGSVVVDACGVLFS
jgi:hypothetical protein